MNVLILMVDEMAPWVPENGVRLPALDALRARGVTFSAAYTPSPICVPARASIATGRWLHEIGHWSSAEPYDGRVRSWAHSARDAGAEVVSFGKLHYRNGTDDTGFSRQVEPVHVVDGVGWVRGLLRQPLCDYAPTAEMAQDIGAGHTDYHNYDRRVAAAAAAWLAEPARRDRPWCAFVSFFSPHYPLVAPPEDYALYEPAAYATGAEPLPDHPVLREIGGFFDHDPHFSPQARGIARAAYRGLCTFVDRQVGRVLDALQASGQAEETLVILASDHGEMLGRHGFWTKSVMYEDAARVPLVVAGPGVAPGVRDDPVSLIDIAPTVAAALGLPREVYSGVSLTDAPPADRTVISEYHDGGSPVGITMVRWTDGAGRWKYVHYAQGHPCQLFELGSDPGEDRDLAAARPEVVAKARRRLAGFMDAEAVDARAHADQAARVEALGGREALLAMEQWNYTPADGG